MQESYKPSILGSRKAHSLLFLLSLMQALKEERKSFYLLRPLGVHLDLVHLHEQYNGGRGNVILLLFDGAVFN